MLVWHLTHQWDEIEMVLADMTHYLESLSMVAAPWILHFVDAILACK